MTPTPNTALPPVVEAPGDQEGVGLPELPCPAITYADHSYPAFSKAQMEAYAREAVAARAEGRPSPEPGELERRLREYLARENVWSLCPDACSLIEDAADALSEPVQELQGVGEAADHLEGMAGFLRECTENVSGIYGDTAQDIAALEAGAKALRALSSPEPGGSEFVPIPLTEEVIGYVARYGGMCRDCADEAGICPSSGLPCDDEADKAIKHVITALNYGFGKGYLKLPASERGSEFVRVPRAVLEPFVKTAEVLDNTKDSAVWAGQRPAAPITFGDFRRLFEASQGSVTATRSEGGEMP